MLPKLPPDPDDQCIVARAAGRSARLVRRGKGWVSVEPCERCGHTRCGPSCTCPCGAARAHGLELAELERCGRCGTQGTTGPGGCIACGAQP